MEESKTTFKITEASLLDKARIYIPFAEKKSWVDDVVVRCFDPIEVSGVGDGSAMPSMYKENQGRKLKYLAGALAKLYLGESFSPENAEDQWMMTNEDFDFFWGSHPIGQIERVRRYSKNKELQDNCYDMIQDYKELREMLNSEIHGYLRTMNDVLYRFQMLMAAQITPEYMQTLVNSMNEAKTELEEYTAHRTLDASETDGEN